MGFEQVGPPQWKKMINQVQSEFEDKYWTDGGLQEEIVDFLGGSSPDADTSSESDSSEYVESDSDT